MMAKKLDWTAPLLHVDGRSARLICSDLGGAYPYAVAVMNDHNQERLVQVDDHGVSHPAISPSPTIINGPVVRWVNVYRGAAGELRTDGHIFEKDGAAMGGVDAKAGKLVGRVRFELREEFDDDVA